MRKACKLTLSTRQRIGNFRKKNPTISTVDISEKFNCTYNQARKAIEDYNAGKLAKNPPKQRRNIGFSPKTIDADKNLEEQYKAALLALENTNYPADARISLLDKLISMRKKIQSITLQNHIKQADADLIAIIVRKFEPDASEDRIIAIYKEALIIKNAEAQQ